MSRQLIQINREMFDHKNKERFVVKAPEGITEEVVRMISKKKNEPEWMLQKRLRALHLFNEMPLPTWGPSLAKLNLNKITYYAQTDEKAEANSWEDVPEDIRKTFEKLGIPEAERKSLSGVGAQYDSEVVYHNLKKQWGEKGVIFENMDIAVKKYPELVKKYFMTNCVPMGDHKFAALHAAVWSGGTFIYIPKDVKVEIPLQAYFRMNAAGLGQFEHTLIIVDKNAEVSYIEGCSAPYYTKNNLHAGCVEIYVMENARARYSSIENWSKNTYNLNTKRAIVNKNATMEWVNGNMGSNITMLYPCTVLRGEYARADFTGIAFAGKNQNQDTGCKMIHLAENTSSTIKSKSISKDGGITTYRGLLKIIKGAKNVNSSIRCDALLLDDISKTNTIPRISVKENTADVVHEATVGRIDEESIFYLMSRGISEEEARKMIVSGFIEPITKQLPGEYAIELNRLIELEMEDSIG
ncbi:Fe-S cluster assembly protein SufB [Candidatus Woesearchaeota archaeon]|nr:Fe-S cluster assembly protein SufB [Candidatus Woesearchaeota archaeon]